MRGGQRPGAGRKLTPAPKKPITIRLPQWLVEWLKQRNQSKAIEEALIKQHDLKPPY